MAVRQKVFKLYSCFTDDLIGILSEIDISISPGIPTFDVIGLCDSSIREAKGRVRAAIISSGFVFPKGHITIGISPAYMRKSGSSFDLPIALGILICSNQINVYDGAKIYAEGELSFDGLINKSPGSLLRLKTQNNSYDYSFIPEQEIVSAYCSNYEGMACKSLKEVANSINYNSYYKKRYEFNSDLECIDDSTDFSVLKGQEKAIRSILIAASGMHNLLMLGSNGCGKTLAANLIRGIMPPLNNSEISDVYSVLDSCGYSVDSIEQIDTRRPYRLIHPGLSYSQIFGGKSKNSIGEIILANHGVLFADEICEFKREVIEGLRIPLESHSIDVRRDGIDYSIDSNFVFVAAGNPCKCGMLYEGRNKCRCTISERNRYLKRLSGPFLDRIDLFVEMINIDSDSLKETANKANKNLNSTYREIVSNVWDIQNERYAHLGKRFFNGNVKEIDMELLRIPENVVEFAAEMSTKSNMSARGYNKLLRVSRTIADIGNHKDVDKKDVIEALIFRQRLDNGK